MDSIWGIIGAVVLVTLIGFLWSYPDHDSTDGPDGKRSGLIVFTDHATGVQYVTTTFGYLTGNITPRLNSDGRPFIENN